MYDEAVRVRVCRGQRNGRCLKFTQFQKELQRWIFLDLSWSTEWLSSLTEIHPVPKRTAEMNFPLVALLVLIAPQIRLWISWVTHAERSLNSRMPETAIQDVCFCSLVVWTVDDWATGTMNHYWNYYELLFDWSDL